MAKAQLFIAGWMDKQIYIHAMEYYSALKKMEILTHAIINTAKHWGHYIKRNKPVIVPLIWCTQSSQTHKPKKINVYQRLWERGNGELFNRYRVSILQDENMLVTVQHCECT